MSYNSSDFLKPIGTDKNIKIYNSIGDLSYTIKPTFINTIISNINVLDITLKNSKVISLDFINIDESVDAEIKLQKRINDLLQISGDIITPVAISELQTIFYSYDKFLRPLTESDRNIKILDDFNITKYTIDPFSIINTKSTNNLVKISLRSGKVIVLDFSTTNESKLALIRLREQIDILIQKTPILIDKDIENYIINLISQNSGPTGVTGSTGSSGTNGTSGSSGTSGTDGTSGTSGTGITGTTGSNGTSGSSGTSGQMGPSGFGIEFQGQLGSTFSLPQPSTQGYAYLINNVLWVYDSFGNWVDGGQIQGPQGESGTSGSSGTSGTSGLDGTSGTSGTSGLDGLQGSPGLGIWFQGQLGSTASLPQPSTQGYAYLIDSVLWVYNSSGDWVDGGSIQGPQGIQGTNGTSGSSGTSGSEGSSGTSGTSGITGATGPQGIGVTSSFFIKGTTQSAYDTISTIYRTGAILVGTASIVDATDRFIVSTGGTASLVVDSDGNVYNRSKGITNTLFGYQAGLIINTATSSTAFGYQALVNNNSTANTAFGYRALFNNGNIVASLTSLVGGSGYTTGTFSNVQLTYLSGSSASTYPTVTIFVGSGGTVSSVSIVSAGRGFKDNTTIMSATFSTGTGFSIKVNSLATGGSNNTAIGFQSLLNNTTSGFNTAIGYASLQANQSGGSNTAIGFQSLLNNINGFQNVAIGYNSLFLNISGNQNTAIGYQALNTNNGSFNTAIGYNSLLSNSSGGSNIAVGHQSLNSNTTASFNTAIGVQALFSNTNGTQNTALGYYSLYNNTSFNNTAVGYYSLYSNSTGYYNTAVGFQSLVNISVGYNNTALGMYSGYIHNSYNSVFIGYNANALSGDQDNQIVIGTDTTGNGSNTVTIGNNNIVKTILTGDLGFGTIDPLSKVHIVGQITIQDGTEGVGKVLTSDANGLATWELSSGSGSGGTGSTGATGPGYYGTSSTIFSIPLEGFMVELQTQPNLGYSTDQWVVISSEAQYAVAEYYDEFTSPLFYGVIDDYDTETGILNVVCKSSNLPGITFSQWSINITGERGPVGERGPGYYGTSSTIFSMPVVGFMKELVTQPNLGYSTDQWVVISSDAEYAVTEYYDEFTSPYFYAVVDDYDTDTGLLNVICKYSTLPGITFSQWSINITGELSSGTSSGVLMLSTTYNDLVTLVDNSLLTPGMQYRINDYVTIIDDSAYNGDVMSTEIPFDIIVVADDVNKLNESARAIKNASDTYFPDTTNFQAWELKYSINNDNLFCDWVSATFSKGVIYWMKDDNGNECSYDFKNIMYKRYEITDAAFLGVTYTYSYLYLGIETETWSNTNAGLTFSNNWVWSYTFNEVYGNDYTTYETKDSSVFISGDLTPYYLKGCNNNIIKEYTYNVVIDDIVYSVRRLNNITFVNRFRTDFDIISSQVNNNVFKQNCYNLSFLNKVNDNTFNYTVNNNIFLIETLANTFDSHVSYNLFGYGIQFNKISKNFYNNLIEAFGDNTIGENFSNNIMLGGTYNNIFADNFNSNTTSQLYYNTFSGNIISNIFGNQIRDNYIGNGFSYNNIGSGLQNTNIRSGIRGTSSVSRKDWTGQPIYNKNYPIDIFGNYSIGAATTTNTYVYYDASGNLQKGTF